MLRTQFFLSLSSHLDLADYEGGALAEVLIDTALGNGTDANQADKLYQDTRPLGATSAEDLDLQALTDANGVAIALAEVRCLIIQADSTNGNNIEIKPSAATGWLALQKDASDISIIAPSATLCLFAPADGGYAVSGSAKDININNTDSSPGSYTITIVGTSA